MAGKRIRIALVGAGSIGRIHLKSYAGIPRLELTGICDQDLEAAQALAMNAGVPAFTSLDEMLNHIPVDAVDICTPTSEHLAPALSAIGRGLHVLCEKPLANSPDRASQIVAAAEARGVLLMTAFCHRFHPPVAFVRHLIDSGRLGEVVQFRNRFASLHPGIESRWFAHKQVSGGGAFLDTSIHSIDLFRFLVGEVYQVQAAMRRTNAAVKEVEDTATALLTTEDGRMGVIESSWALADGYNVVEVYGTEGAAMVHYWDGMASRYKLSTMSDWEKIPDSPPDRFVREISHFVDACLGESKLMVTGADGARAVEIDRDAYRSAGWE